MTKVSKVVRSQVVTLLALLLSCGSRTELWTDPAQRTELSSDSVELDCPTGLDDPRLPIFSSGRAGTLDASAFVQGTPTYYRWSVVERDCDAIATFPRYQLQNAGEAIAQLTPGRPANYQIRLEVGDEEVQPLSCEFEIPVEGQGIRVELCWRDDTRADLDLFLHSPHNQEPFRVIGNYINEFGHDTTGWMPSGDSCNVINCTPQLRLGMPRVDFGYPDSSAELCQAGPDAQAFSNLGICPNPRAATDSNTIEYELYPGGGTRGLAEIIQLDDATEGDTFRVMVHNYNNMPAYLRLFVYCNGSRMAFEPPTEPEDFAADDPGEHGVMWRPVDVIAKHDLNSKLGCVLTPVAHPSLPGQPYLTINDASY
jgi:hypothetical protein